MPDNKAGLERKNVFLPVFQEEQINQKSKTHSLYVKKVRKVLDNKAKKCPKYQKSLKITIIFGLKSQKEASNKPRFETKKSTLVGWGGAFSK